MSVPTILGVSFAMADGKRVQRMQCVSCPEFYDTSIKGQPFPEDAIFRFARNHGWLPARNGKHVCPKCQEKKAMPSDTPREMTPADKRAIFREIDGCYDEKRGRYVDDWTDQAIATKLAMPRKLVTDVREENFGPSGENTELERVVTLLSRIDGDVRAAIDKCMTAAAEAEKLGVEVTEAKERVEQLRRAFGPHRVTA